MEVVGNELHQQNDFAEIYEVKDMKEKNENKLRVFCDQFPNIFKFQIRTHKPINGFFGNGKPRNMIAHLSLTIEEVEEILNYMKNYKLERYGE